MAKYTLSVNVVKVVFYYWLHSIVTTLSLYAEKERWSSMFTVDSSPMVDLFLVMGRSLDMLPPLTAGIDITTDRPISQNRATIGKLFTANIDSPSTLSTYRTRLWCWWCNRVIDLCGAGGGSGCSISIIACSCSSRRDKCY